jgi:hypothetical protein
MLPTTDDANALLEIFQGQACLYFPFISVPKSTSAEELRRERPFLYLAIMAVTSRKSYQKEELGKFIVRQIAERVFVNGERSLDLLLGVLTFAAWFVPQAQPHILYSDSHTPLGSTKMLIIATGPTFMSTSRTNLPA